MKSTIKLSLLAFVASAFMVSCGSGTEADAVSEQKEVAEMSGETYTVDTDSSVIDWRGEKFTGDAHFGTINVKEGELTVENGAITAGKFTIDMNSIVVTDETPEDYKKNLLAHLKGTTGEEKDADFFQVTKYPTASFEITGVEGNQISGNLTMLDSTHNVTFTATTTIEDGKLTAITEDFTFDRTLWGIKFLSTLVGKGKDVAIKDEITIKISLTANAAEATEETVEETEATE